MTRPTTARSNWAGYYAAGEGRDVRDLVVRGAAATAAPGRALDLGCGDGTETAWLLERGWRVWALDVTPEAMPLVRAKAEAARAGDRLDTVVADLATAALPAADLVLACASLPFVEPGAFDGAWSRVRAALRPGGVLAVNLFGTNDSWADAETGVDGMTFQARAEVEELLAGLHVVELTETEWDGPSGRGPKHWHRFDVVAHA
ncbi:Methyltransferase type 12 [Beutenbergia cavernae DSM 12333]|uniref:Methyltransferase type 12 n=1 Tax=Beutenbergia cavernae (strain ATCC BAA-8 / DSM 12333 / CCUG 43141 / JCM 11478 / NBRC 16432 / NCIMB 13614 / HKI 0122) TaxID=471853 RepID=C5BXX7_BEUC1|nr:class I SAM-dependent methyltransferase [Beutenbergia cavernae]ACQ78871.1 Methyltransferase type 12 [Beutenbergia cavernae DSM 12333]